MFPGGLGCSLVKNPRALPFFSSLAVQVQSVLEEAGPSDVGTTCFLKMIR